MSRTHATATPPTSATAVVTVDPVGDEHRTLFPGILDTASHVIAIRRDSVLADCYLFIASPAELPGLRGLAMQYADHWRFAYFEPCGWCGINCSPADRIEHERYARTSESTYRARWAA